MASSDFLKSLEVLYADTMLQDFDYMYKKLKQHVYYDSVNLFLRKRLADFDISPDRDERIQKILKFLDSWVKSTEESNDILDAWLEDISFKIMPKSLANSKSNATAELNDIKYISNIRTYDKYWIDGVNYFIDMPIELHIIDVFWTSIVGNTLDKGLSGFCLGNRLERNALGNYPIKSSQMFKLFHLQYSKWRDTAIINGQKALESNTNVVLIGLDIKQFFYNINVDWDKINSKSTCWAETRLSYIIKHIHKRYYNSLKTFLKKTHEISVFRGIPVGLASSQVISNFVLSEFDQKITTNLSPLYYGRYVDDILIVLSSIPESIGDKGSKIINSYLIEKGILFTKEHDPGILSLCTDGDLCVQKSKLVIQYFDPKHSHAGLKEFCREIATQASEFRFLPTGEDMKEIDDCAYDLIYHGSINKLRSLVGVEENSTELSKYLSNRIMLYKLTQEKITIDQMEQIFRFYRGKNYFDFMRLWEKVFTLLLINGREEQANSFYYECRNTFITKAQNTWKKKNISMKIKEDMQEYLDIALSLPIGLRSKLFLIKLKEKLPKIASHKQIMNNARRFRRANLIRHQFVSYPLLNYIESNDHDLTVPLAQIRHNKSYKMDSQKIENTPRYIHYDEFQLFELLGDFTTKNLNSKRFDFRKSRKRFKQEPVKAEESESPRIYSKVTIGKKNVETNENEIDVTDGTEYDVEKRKGNSGRGDGFRIGIVNLKVDERDIESAYIPGKKPNLSFGRQAKLHSLLNDSIRNPSCDLVIFPEVSIPFAWLPIMVSFARKHQIGIVLGLEHVIFNNLAFNLVVAILPYKTESGFNACHISVRPKNHYAPDENDCLMQNGFTPFSLKEPHYDLFHWRKTYFSVFNCFELSDITHKSILRSKIDFLLTVAWNKDINYYDNILSSIARDIHCYVVHSNTSQYGDSRVIVPARTEDKDPIRITGGETPVLMKYTLNIEALRNFQIQNYNPDNKQFKPLPAGYDKQAAQDRILDK